MFAGQLDLLGGESLLYFSKFGISTPSGEVSRTIMRSLSFTVLLTGILAVALACDPPQANSPTEGYKRLYAAVKSKDVEKIKAAMSKKTQDFAQMVAGRQNSPVEKVYENGFTATTFSDTLPEIRDERVNGEWGAVEVWNAKEKRWEDLGFVNEDGAWKLAIGEMFAGTFKSPGKGRALKEQEAANLLSNNLVPMNMNTNANNANVKVIVPKERQQTNTNK